MRLALRCGALAESGGDVFEERFIAHFVRGAFGGDGVLELRGVGEVVGELLLDGAGAGEVDFVGILHVAGDLLEVLVEEGLLAIVGGVFAGVAAGSGIFDMGEDGEFGGLGIPEADDGGVAGIEPDAELFLVFY